MTISTKHVHALLAATALVALPAPALAQDKVAAQANKVADKAQDLQAATNKLDAAVANTQANDADAAYAANDRDGDRGHDDGDDDHGKWGLLGLLGLAGLLGLKRRDHDHVDIDRRHDVDRTTTRTTARGGTTGVGTDDTRL